MTTFAGITSLSGPAMNRLDRILFAACLSVHPQAWCVGLGSISSTSSQALREGVPSLRGSTMVPQVQSCPSSEREREGDAQSIQCQPRTSTVKAFHRKRRRRNHRDVITRAADPRAPVKIKYATYNTVRNELLGASQTTQSWYRNVRLEFDSTATSWKIIRCAPRLCGRVQR
jgi:hypothetical protein